MFAIELAVILSTQSLHLFILISTFLGAISEFNGNNAIVLQTIFLAINVIIAVRILWKGYQAWSAREAGEEYQSTINGIIMGLGVLYALEFVANKIVGE